MIEKSVDNELSLKLIDFELPIYGMPKWRYPVVIEKYDLEHKKDLN